MEKEGSRDRWAIERKGTKGGEGAVRGEGGVKEGRWDVEETAKSEEKEVEEEENGEKK